MTKTALITGATGGIGLEVTRCLAERGYALTLVDFDASALNDLAGMYPGTKMHVLDQRKLDEVEMFCDTIIEAGESAPDVAIVNAGIIRIGDLTEISRADITDQVNVNLVSGAFLIQSVARRMVKAGRGHILATVSMGGIVSMKGSATYAASKFGLRGLLWGLRDELKPKGVDVTGIFPSGVDTPVLRHEALNGGSALNFLSPPVTASDVANAFMKAIDKPRLEVYVPGSDGVSGRILGAWPGLLSRLYPRLEKMGEAGRRKYIKKINAREQTALKTGDQPIALTE